MEIPVKNNRREILRAAALLAPFRALAEGPTALASGTLSPAQAKHADQPYGETWQYFSGRTAELSLLSANAIRLKPGMAPHPPHTHPEPEIMLVTEGTGQFTIEGKKTAVGPGSMAYCAGNREHGVVNTGKTPMTYFFWKWKR